MGVRLEDLPPAVRERVRLQMLEDGAVRVRAAARHPRQPGALRPLVEEVEGGGQSESGVVCRVTLVLCRPRRLDSDSVPATLKWLRDAVAKSLGVDDGDERVEWEYGQCVSNGTEGVVVKVERLGG